MVYIERGSQYVYLSLLWSSSSCTFQDGTPQYTRLHVPLTVLVHTPTAQWLVAAR